MTLASDARRARRAPLGMGVLTRLKIALRDYVFYSSLTGALVGVKAWLYASIARGPRKAACLADAMRRLPEGVLLHHAAERLRRLIDERPDDVVTAQHAVQVRRALDPALTRTTLLKAPGADGERGVMFCQFEYNWGRLMEGVGPLQSLLSTYDVIWGASWSPLDYLALARVLATSDGPVYVHPANLREMGRIATLHPRVRVVPQLAGEFQNPDAAKPVPFSERDIDLTVISNWAPFKRHWELFAALRRMPADLKIVLIGQPETGYDKAHILRLMRLYGVRQSVDVRECIPLEEVHALLGRSKASAVFSRREGQCIAAVEALFAGASLGLRRDAAIGSAAYVNARTGVLLEPDRMADSLMELIAKAGDRAPRDWAMEHLGRDLGTQRLDTWLAEQAAARGLPWTRGIARHWWSPYPWVGDDAPRAALGPAARALHARYPATFRDDMMDSCRR